jgi:23S rRNA (adenine2503-C2)-methyltransferase
VSDTEVIRRPRLPVVRSERPVATDFPRPQLADLVASALGGPRFRTEQIFEWLHRHRAADFDSLSNVSAADRAKLAAAAELPHLRVEDERVAADGTRKLRLRTVDEHAIETVLIPNEGRGLTQCVSSMVGCSLTCRFCATATLGFQRSLATWEIVDQVYRAQDLLAAEAARTGAQWAGRITNVVFMGMGEPLHNYDKVRRAIAILTDPHGAGLSGRRITVSTAGLVPAIERFGREGLGHEVGLAVSLNATTDAVRDQIMPINTRWNIAALLAAVRELPSPTRRRLTFEYVLLGGVNDTDGDIERLPALVGDLRAQINVIPYNPHPGAPFRRPDSARVHAFVAGLRARGLLVHVRTPRGDDIAAACGQLALEGTAASA